METEIAFTLPRGYVDASGTVHREGVMRLATARDEIEPLRSADVRENQAYLSVLLLARTVKRIGTVSPVTPALVEELFAVDFDHLQRLYERLNTDAEAVGVVSCPSCEHRFEVDLTEIEDGRLGKGVGRLPTGCLGRRPASPITSSGRWTRSSISSTETGGASSMTPKRSRTRGGIDHGGRAHAAPSAGAAIGGAAARRDRTTPGPRTPSRSAR
jgi:hypothetical protein